MDENNFLVSSRELPHSIEAEQSVIGAVLADSSVLPVVVEKIKPEYFYSEQHKAIYSIITRMFTSGLPVDIITVLDEAEKLHIFESSAEGKRYLAEIGNTLPSTSNIESYCKIVADKFFIRTLGYAARTILEDIQSGEHDAQLLLDAAEQKIYDIRQGRDVKGLIPISEAITEAYDRLGKISGPDKEKYVGARTGFTLLDSITSGLNKSDLIIIAARPGMGKTSFVLNIGTNVAKATGKAVAMFSLEMSSDQLVQRVLSSEAMVESNALRSGNLTEEDWTKLAHAASELAECDILIDDTTGQTITGMKAKLRRVKNLGLVIIDYLQLMNSDRKIYNRVQEVADISRNLKIMAKELNVPIICCAQLSRGPESRTDKKPMLSDLRDSGAIEQDADVVMFIYRDEYYKTDRPAGEDEQAANTASIIIAKNRHGGTGEIKVGWIGQYTKFRTIDNEMDM